MQEDTMVAVAMERNEQTQELFQGRSNRTLYKRKIGVRGER